MAASNKIEIYPQNTKSISCIVSGLAVTGYTPYMTVKKQTTDQDTVLSKTGTISDASTLLFALTSTDTSILYGDYVYDITIEKDASKYTVTKDKFTVIDGVRY